MRASTPGVSNLSYPVSYFIRATTAESYLCFEDTCEEYQGQYQYQIPKYLQMLNWYRIKNKIHMTCGSSSVCINATSLWRAT